MTEVETNNPNPNQEQSQAPTPNPKAMPMPPQGKPEKKIDYIKNKKGDVIGVHVNDQLFRIAKYSLMMNKPSYYLYDNIGIKVVNADSFQELDFVIKKIL